MADGMGKIIRGPTLSSAHPGMAIIPASGAAICMCFLFLFFKYFHKVNLYEEAKRSS